MSKLETNTIDTISGTTNLTIGSTNSSTVTFENGAVTGHNYPAFFAHVASNTSMSDATSTKMVFGTEVYDTNNLFDNSASRFTVTSSTEGRYFLYNQTQLQAAADNQFNDGQVLLQKNGTTIHQGRMKPSGDGQIYTINLTFAIDLVANDYIEVFGYVDDSAGGSPEYNGNASQYKSYFGAYRIGA
jgi:hypothetical protein